MSDRLIRRLRAALEATSLGGYSIFDEAADCIEELQKELGQAQDILLAYENGFDRPGEQPAKPEAAR